MLTENQEKLVYWINERESIRLRKASGMAAPWSNDPIFRTTYFTNINREDDKVTRWIRENWWFYSDRPYDFAMIVARIFNNPDTLFEIGQPTYPLEDWLWLAEDILQARRDRGERVWNGAYIISTNGKKMDKLAYCINEILSPLCDLPEITNGCSTLEEAHKQLSRINGLGSFLAAQVVADLKNSVGHPLTQAKDWSTFCAPGPGSLRGLSWFWGEKITPASFSRKIQEAFELLQWELGDDILKLLCMQNFQNCFCEYDKYMRILNGTGRSKRKYNGE